MNERLKQYGATLSATIALGGFAVGCAEAKTTTATSASQEAAPTRVENSKDKLPIAAPKGVKSVDSVAARNKEISEAITHLHRRWEGVLVLRPPKVNADVGFTLSPTDYGSVENPDLGVIKGGERKVVIPRPGIERFHGRDYAVMFDGEFGRWAFLDIKFARDTGALQMYDFKGKKSKVVEYPLEKQRSDMPAIYGEAGFGADWMLAENTRDDVLQSIMLPTITDPNAKEYKVVPSKTFPHS